MLLAVEIPQYPTSPYTEITKLGLKFEDEIRKLLFEISGPMINIKLYEDTDHSQAGAETALRTSAIGVSIADFIILCVAAAFPREPLSRDIFAFLTIVSVLPVAFSVLFNWAWAKIISDGAESVREMERRTQRIRRDFDEKVVKAKHAFIEAVLTEVDKSKR